VDISKRLRELREAKGLRQGDVEDRTGLPRTLVSLVENGRLTPTLQILETSAKALDVELHQLFTLRNGQPDATVLPERIPSGAQLRTLLGLLGQMSAEDRALLISLARGLLKRKGKRG
jgi:transcriptional regulator with XRE-family HTH domain